LWQARTLASRTDARRARSERVRNKHMTVTVNGETREITDRLSVAELLDTLAVPPGRVAVEVNEEVVPRQAYTARRIANGDRIEIVHFVGGG